MRKVRVNTLPGFENVTDNYWITDGGQVLSERKGMRPLKQRPTKPTKHSRNRYLQITMATVGGHANGRNHKASCKVHRLVALAFVPNPHHYREVNHKNEDGHDNRAINLEWVTPKQNSRYSNVKKVYCYDMNGLVKIYDTTEDTIKDGFNKGHVAAVCRGAISSPGRNPELRHKGHVFSYEPMDMKEVVQRLSKPSNYKPKGWSAWKNKTRK
ncbi:HNH endonuclease [Limosilactobacillus vaginalis]|uniref:HNH endonuclease n=1 Tax=Limosilactobacillus vaginalis TaxID=1633 RepID=UPI003734D36F